jgi:hypothetical protein
LIWSWRTRIIARRPDSCETVRNFPETRIGLLTQGTFLTGGVLGAGVIVWKWPQNRRSWIVAVGFMAVCIMVQIFYWTGVVGPFFHS